MKTNALAREKRARWQNPKRQGLLALVQVTSEATNDGMIRAAKIHQFLRLSVVLALRGAWGLWRAMLAHPGLVLRKCPREKVEFFEEYESLRESHLFSTIVRK